MSHRSVGLPDVYQPRAMLRFGPQAIHMRQTPWQGWLERVRVLCGRLGLGHMLLDGSGDTDILTISGCLVDLSFISQRSCVNLERTPGELSLLRKRGEGSDKA